MLFGVAKTSEKVRILTDFEQIESGRSLFIGISVMASGGLIWGAGFGSKDKRAEGTEGTGET